jgi:hypothetical protein
MFNYLLSLSNMLFAVSTAFNTLFNGDMQDAGTAGTLHFIQRAGRTCRLKYNAPLGKASTGGVAIHNNTTRSRLVHYA